MKRRLILMRHAKSAWDTDADSDHARPLSKRGRKDAPRVGAYLAAQGWTPELVCASDSRRTRETWARLSEALEDGDDIEVAFDHGLYGGDLGDIIEAARDWPAGVETVLVLGHNPGWEEALEQLTGEGETMTTGNAALLEGAGASWVAALGGEWRLRELVRPKELGG